MFSSKTVIGAIALLSLFIAISIQPAPAQEKAAKEQKVSVQSALKLPALFGDNMVLQRDRKVPVWGWAAPGEKVTVSINGKSASATADEKGKWKTETGPFSAGGPYEMKVSGKDSEHTVKNVLIGEVWLCSGQSNMEMHVGPGGYGKGVMNVEKELASANYPKLRMLTVKRTAAAAPVDDVDGKWQVCSPESVGAFSATGYFFGRDLQKDLDVPVGLVNASWGMMFISTFTSRETLASDPQTKRQVDGDDAKVKEYYGNVDKYIEKLKQWKTDSANAEAAGVAVPTPPQMPEDYRVSPFRMSTLYNGMIAPVAPYGMRGAIWYQGESNTIGPEGYTADQAALIRDWRRAWNRDDFAFLFVQLPNIIAGKSMFITEDSWARFREAQAKTLAIPQTGMAVTIDVGDPVNIHPANKQAVGKRLALAAEGRIYGKKIVYSGPVYDSMKIDKDRVRLDFQHVGGGLVAKKDDGTFSTDGDLKWFTIAGAERKFVPARARIEGNSVVVWSDEVKNPEAVRYAWTNNPEGVNLYNKDGLPTSSFRTDDWKRETVK